ncbi:TetR/AcrR family transcriptional regulator [Glutamicibacter sp.]|uniref:TetR/AcrR family transcriptional regulator n=1 Tax=Glutamicibacter sp. TaxID=1931995 RepID=UPI0028BD8249|nr:TetR/AcrR family transcriptional regulator [Glutamicibacter sp.]
MDTLREQIVSGSEKFFDQHGFNGSGMDQLTQAIGVSTRTLYKHAGNKNSLIAASLKLRSEKFFSSIAATNVDEFFGDLERWLREEGARGCLFLRARGEGLGFIPEIALIIDQYHRQLRDLVADLVDHDATGDNSELQTQILVLFEGAVAAAPYAGLQAVFSARSAAATLLDASKR